MLDTTCRPNTASPSTFSVHVYAAADKYDVPPLRRLIVHRMEELCDPVEDLDDFVAVLRVTDACTANRALWDILLPKAKTNITQLLQDESFRWLAMELLSLTLPLLGMLDQNECMKVLGRRKKALNCSFRLTLRVCRFGLMVGKFPRQGVWLLLPHKPQQ